MSTDRIRFASGVDGLEALGATSIDDLFRPEGLATFARAEEIPDFVERVVRVPLPGTPDAAGRVHERPRGAGTGWIVLRVFRSWRGALSGRFTRPRSTSEAERRWNLACHLRAAGVATPDLVAVAARGNGLWSGTSALVVRDLERMIPLDAWLHSEMTEEERRLGIEAVGAALERVERSGAVFPRLRPGGILVLLRGEGACGAEMPVGGALHRLPGVAIEDLAGGFLVEGDEEHPRVVETYRYVRSEIEGLLREDEWELFAATASREGVQAGVAERSA